ncbi:hypothetical protein ACFO1B_52475 [Dactylosporangium siamense]|uniref:Uncharacterized protein n=1 Tax=Dactylosporangium siamense TaxID=685454 RepID=A0A919PDQ4_9ACTN|nr:hypothetical protein [Dactylosporangium siamense]GIG42307.1 hypothetical protein Dsi01nite_003480 [Dactylosporangium siamense]
MRFEQLLQETIDEMTGEMTAPRAGLAARSMARGRRIRRARRVATAGAAILAAVAVALPWTLLSQKDAAAPSPAAQPTRTPAMTRTELPGGWVVAGVGDQVLDRATNEYVLMRKPVLPAPVGNRILVIDGPESLQLTSVRGADPVTVDPAGLVGTFNWSPAGDRLVGGITQKEPFKVGFAVIDARTGAISKHWIDHDRHDCSRCDFTWTRDGQEVVLPIADRSGGEAEERVSELQLFNAGTGEPTRSLPITALPAGPFAWSPGGRYVVVGPPGTSEGWQLYDTTTGQHRPFPYPAVWVTADVLLATKNGKVLTLTPDGTVTATIDVAAPNPGMITFGPPR